MDANWPTSLHPDPVLTDREKRSWLEVGGSLLSFMLSVVSLLGFNVLCYVPEQAF